MIIASHAELPVGHQTADFLALVLGADAGLVVLTTKPSSAAMPVTALTSRDAATSDPEKVRSSAYRVYVAPLAAA